MASLLELSGLCKSFGALVVTDHVSLAVRQGEAVGIIGPNGAGKSSLFNQITGDVMPDAGRITFGGRNVGALPPYARARLGIGRSYQIPRPFSGMTVYENLMVGAKFAGADRVRDASTHCRRILEMTGLFEMADKPGKSLTLLGRKRLELARALATAPKLLLLDEIAGGLTEAEATDLVTLIRAIQATGVTIIWIEHVLHALVAVVSHLIVLDAGKLVAEGAPDAVMNEPLVREIYLGHEEDAVA